MLSIAAIMLVILALGFMLPVEEGTPAFQDGYRIGRTFAALLMPGLIAYVVAGRKKSRKPNLFALLFCVIAIFSIGGLLSGSVASSYEAPEQHFARLMREAAGLQPVRQAMFPRQRRWDDAIREQYRRLLQQNRDYDQAVQKLNAGRVHRINSPETFLDRQAAVECLNRLHAVFAVDSDQEAKVKQIMGDLRAAVATGAQSPEERKGILEAYDRQLASQMSKRAGVFAAEKAWNDSIEAEYSYAAQHSRDFRLLQGRLVIANAAVREEFNALLDSQEARRKEFQSVQKSFAENRSQTMEKFGIKPKDTGQ